MDWAKENKFLSAFIAVFVIGIVVLGFLLISTYGSYKETRESYDNVASQVGALKGKEIFPNKGNLDTFTGQVAEYEGAVDELQVKLKKYQRPLALGMTDRQLQGKLNQKVQDLKRLCINSGIELDEKFALGMGRYMQALPSTPAVAELDYILDGLVFMVEKLVGSGALEIGLIEREILQIESGVTPKKEEDGRDSKRKKKDEEPIIDVVKQYPFSITFKTTPVAFEKFINDIGNTGEGEPYFNVRYLSIHNEKQEGPSKVPFKARVLREKEAASGGVEDEDEDEEEKTPKDVVRRDVGTIIGNEDLEIIMNAMLLRFSSNTPAVTE